MNNDTDMFAPLEFLDDPDFIEACTVRITEEQDVIIDQGSFTKDLFIIRSGRFIVSDSMGEEFILAALNPGDVFGEMSFFGSGIRSATVTCVEPGEVLSLSREEFKIMHDRNPDLTIRICCNLARLLSDRLKHADSTLSLLADDSELRQRYEIRRLIKELKGSIHKKCDECTEDL